jgi:plastocyanin
MKPVSLSLLFTAAVVSLLSLRSAQAASYNVLMSNFVFTPASLSIGQGDTVTWTNTAPLTPHTSTSGSPPGTPNGLWTSGTVNPNLTFSLTFNGFGPGSYPYYCSFHTLQNMAGTITITNGTVAPSVSLTNPASGAKMLAPADIALMATAAQTGGTITNVGFYSGTSLLGNATAAPFNFTLNAQPAGNYSFSAVAMSDLGLAATSSVVNVFVLTNAVISNPQPISGQFQLTIHGIAGQTYATEASSNLVNWVGIATNVAPADTFNVLDPAASNAATRFYRARQNL